MQIDELPVGQSKKNFMIEEYPPDFDPQQQEKVDLPLKQRIKSKVWKVRLQAYEELSDDPELDCDTLIQIIQDIHIQCQDKALQISIKYFEKHNQLECSQQKEIFKVLLEKVLTQPKLKQPGHQLAVILYPTCKMAIFEIIIQQLLHKNPKVVQATIALLTELLQQYGLKKMDNLKPFFPIMAKLTEAQQSTVKADAIQFYKEAIKWFGKNIEAFFGGLAEKLQQELKKIAETITEVQKAPLQEGEADTGNQELYDLVEAVEVFQKFTDSWCEKVFQMEKWMEKKEQLEILLKACSVPKILPSPNVYSVVQLLKKLINEQNITISTICIKITGAIANGLRKNFNQNAKILMLTILNKLKDKKQNVVDETISTVKKMFFSCNLDEFFEDLKSLLEDKAPGTKVNVFIIIEHYVDDNPKERLNKMQCIKQIVPICKKFTDDGNADVRNRSIILLAKISAKLYNGSMSTELKGDKFTKYQTQVNQYLEAQKALSGKGTENIMPVKTEVQQSIQQQVPKTQGTTSNKQPIVQQNLAVENVEQILQYSSNMSSNQVDAFLKQYKQKNKDNQELGNILLQITQQSKFILQVTLEYVVDRMGDNKQLCYQLFEKCAQAYKPNHISQLIITFKNASTQCQLLEILNLLIKYLPQCDKSIDQQLVSDFLKNYQYQSNLKTRALVQDCQSLLKQIFEGKKIQSEQKCLIPFPLNQFSDLHFDKLREQLKVPQIPQILYEKLFSYNIQQNMAAAQYIKMKITQPGEFAEIFLKWAYLISWMKENIALQSEISQLFSMLINQHKPNVLEQQIVFAYIKMMILLYLRNGMPKLAQRTLPLLMNLIVDYKKHNLSYPSLTNFDDFDEVQNQQANHLLQQMCENSNDWSTNSTIQQKQIIAYLIQQITREESMIINKSNIIQNVAFQPQAQILTKIQNENQMPEEQINRLQKVCVQNEQIIVPVPNTTSESKILQQKNIQIQSQQKDPNQESESKLTNQAQLQNSQQQIPQQQLSQIQQQNLQSQATFNQMEIEQNQTQILFQQNYCKFRETNTIDNPQYFADQIIYLLNSLLKEQQCYDKQNQFFEKLQHIMQSGQFLRSISYDRFYVIFDMLIMKMVEESIKVINKDSAQKSCYNLINLNLIKILNNQELAILYMAFLDVLIKVKEQKIQTKQFYQLLTKCLSKSVEQLKCQFQWSQLQAILERINHYQILCSMPESNSEFQQFQNYVLSALKSTVKFFLHYNDGIKVYQCIMQITTEKSTLRQWLIEFQENNNKLIADLAKYRRSRDTHINQIIELLKIDFDKTVEQFVSIVRRQNLNWKPLVEFLNTQQIKFIELRLEQTSHMNVLEKKVGELEKMLNQ